jgi:RNA polymerase sigma factor (sigma-70 family)
MLKLKQLADVSQFGVIEKQFSRLIKSQVYSFANDRYLKRFQDLDDLYNVGLAKLYEVCCNFEYDESIDEDHNLKRFIAMVRKYVRNAMIDEQYTYHAAKRRPKGTLSSLDQFSDDDEKSGSTLVSSQLTQQCNACSQASANVAISMIGSELAGVDKDVFDMVIQGYPPDKVAGVLGMKVSKVRYIIYETIQPRAIIYGVAT